MSKSLELAEALKFQLVGVNAFVVLGKTEIEASVIRGIHGKANTALSVWKSLNLSLKKDSKYLSERDKGTVGRYMRGIFECEEAISTMTKNSRAKYSKSDIVDISKLNSEAYRTCEKLIKKLEQLDKTFTSI